MHFELFWLIASCAAIFFIYQEPLVSLNTKERLFIPLITLAFFISIYIVAELFFIKKSWSLSIYTNMQYIRFFLRYGFHIVASIFVGYIVADILLSLGIGELNKKYEHTKLGYSVRALIIMGALFVSQFPNFIGAAISSVRTIEGGGVVKVEFASSNNVTDSRIILGRADRLNYENVFNRHLNLINTSIKRHGSTVSMMKEACERAIINNNILSSDNSILKIDCMQYNKNIDGIQIILDFTKSFNDCSTAFVEASGYPLPIDQEYADLGRVFLRSMITGADWWRPASEKIALIVQYIKQYSVYDKKNGTIIEAQCAKIFDAIEEFKNERETTARQHISIFDIFASSSLFMGSPSDEIIRNHFPHFEMLNLLTIPYINLIGHAEQSLALHKMLGERFFDDFMRAMVAVSPTEPSAESIYSTRWLGDYLLNSVELASEVFKKKNSFDSLANVLEERLQLIDFHIATAYSSNTGRSEQRFADLVSTCANDRRAKETGLWARSDIRHPANTYYLIMVQVINGLIDFSEIKPFVDNRNYNEEVLSRIKLSMDRLLHYFSYMSSAMGESEVFYTCLFQAYISNPLNEGVNFMQYRHYVRFIMHYLIGFMAHHDAHVQSVRENRPLHYPTAFGFTPNERGTRDLVCEAREGYLTALLAARALESTDVGKRIMHSEEVFEREERLLELLGSLPDDGSLSGQLLPCALRR